MICQSCRDRHHEGCRGGTWCDCQHQPTTIKATKYGMHLSPAALDPEGLLANREILDQELPGMWESADFTGGQTDMEPGS